MNEALGYTRVSTVDQGDLTVVEIAKSLGVSRASVYRYLPSRTRKMRGQER